MALNYWVYILLCNNDSYYTGYTKDLSHRLSLHLTGKSRCKYTRSFKPISMVQGWKVTGSKALAMKVERYIKTLSRAQKQALIALPHALSHLFAEVEPISKEDKCATYKIKEIISC